MTKGEIDLKEVAFSTATGIVATPVVAKVTSVVVENWGPIGTNEKQIIRLMKNKTLTNQSARTDNYISPTKGYKQAIKEFKKITLKDLRQYQEGTIAGELADGRTVNVRKKSSAEFPTIEIYDHNVKRSIKIRY